MRSIPAVVCLVRLAVAAMTLLGLVLSGPITTAQTVQPAAPVLFVNPAATSQGQPALRAQWTLADGVQNYVLTRNRQPENDPLFKAWGLLPPTQYFVLDDDVKPGLEYRYQVCATYTGPVTLCSLVVPVRVPAQTGGVPSAGTGNGGPAPIIREHTPYQEEIGIRWDTTPATSYNSYSIRFREKTAPANVAASWKYDTEEDDGTWGYHIVRNLKSGTTYMFSVTGCASNGCYNNWGPEYEATTLPLKNIGEMPAPVITATDASDTSITVSWDVPYKELAHPNYGQFYISYREKSGGPETKETQLGNWSNYTIVGLKTGVTYVLYVYGCLNSLGAFNTPAGVDCSQPSASVEVTTKTVTFTTTPLVPALLDLSQPIVTAGNTVKVNGTAFRTTGAVKLTLVGGGKTSDLGTATINTGAFSATVAIPAGTAAGKYKIRAVATPPAGQAANGTTQAEAEVEVVAPGKKGILTATAGGLVYTAIDLDNAFTLNGVNFAAGSITIYVDSTSGPKIGSATVAANGTFKTDITVKSSLGKAVIGPHSIVAVQNDAVVGELAVTFFVPDVIH